MKTLRHLIAGFLLAAAIAATVSTAPVFADEPPAQMGAAEHPCHCDDCGDAAQQACDSQSACAAMCSSFVIADLSFAPAPALAALDTLSTDTAVLYATPWRPPLQPPTV